MQKKTLIAYATTDGHTLRICEHIKATMSALGQQVTLVRVDQTEDLDLSGFERIAIGASIRYGKHQPQVAQFIARHQRLLESRPSAFFTVNIVARKPHKNLPENNPYLLKFLKQISWKPALLDVFAGKLDYPRYGWLDRQMIRFIMLLTKGPTDPQSVVEFTDWSRVEAFARNFCALPPPSPSA
jgi:menaquinone-dependent protoporphyrinogen oxidase